MMHFRSKEHFRKTLQPKSVLSVRRGDTKTSLDIRRHTHGPWQLEGSSTGYIKSGDISSGQ